MRPGCGLWVYEGAPPGCGELHQVLEMRDGEVVTTSLDAAEEGAGEGHSWYGTVEEFREEFRSPVSWDDPV